MNFYDTAGGRRFIDGTMSKLSQNLESIGKDLDRLCRIMENAAKCSTDISDAEALRLSNAEDLTFSAVAEIIMVYAKTLSKEDKQVGSAIRNLDYCLADHELKNATLGSRRTDLLTRHALAVVEPGGSEGIYADIDLVKFGDPQDHLHLFTLKTLDESEEAMHGMKALARVFCKAFSKIVSINIRQEIRSEETCCKVIKYTDLANRLYEMYGEHVCIRGDLTGCHIGVGDDNSIVDASIAIAELVGADEVYSFHIDVDSDKVWIACSK